MEIVRAKSGIASREPVTVIEHFRNARQKNKELVAMVSADEPPRTWTWEQYYDEVETIARAFIRLGVDRFDTVNILGFNSPEWVMANMAAILAGGKVSFPFLGL